MAPEDEVRQASDQFYAALRQMLNGNLGDLESIWSHSSASTAMHPAPPLARDLGWEQVKEGFGVFARLAHGGQISPRDRRIVTGSDMAYATQIEEVQTTMGNERLSFTARSSTVYRRENGAWKVVLHHIDFAPELAEAVGRTMQKDGTTGSTEQDPRVVIQAFDAICNQGDLDRAMDFFAGEAIVRQIPAPPDGGVYHGKEQIRRWLEPQLRGFHVESGDRQVSGEVVTWTAQVIFDLLRQMGFSQPVEARCEAVVHAGKIVSWTVTNHAQAANANANANVDSEAQVSAVTGGMGNDLDN